MTIEPVTASCVGWEQALGRPLSSAEKEAACPASAGALPWRVVGTEHRGSAGCTGGAGPANPVLSATGTLLAGSRSAKRETQLRAGCCCQQLPVLEGAPSPAPSSERWVLPFFEPLPGLSCSSRLFLT